MINMSEAVDRLVEAALISEPETRKSKIKEVALDLTDRSLGGDSLLAFYSLIEALDRLGDLHQKNTQSSANKIAAE